MFDNLSSGHAGALPGDVTLVRGDLLDALRSRPGNETAGSELPPGGGWLYCEVGGETVEAAQARAQQLEGIVGSSGRAEVQGAVVVVDPARTRSLWRIREASAGIVTRLPDGGEDWGLVVDEAAHAAAAFAAFKAAGVDPVPPVTGNDATIAALQLVISGDQYNTISKPSEIVGAAAAQVAAKFLAGETPEAKATLYDTPSELFVPAVVTRENIKAEIFDKGIQTVEEVCTADYADACRELGILK